MWRVISSGKSIANIDSKMFGHKLYASKYSNCVEAQKIFILFHDLGQHSGSFQHFINFVLKEFNDVHIYVMDYVGHGQSSGTRGHFEEFNLLLNDQLNFIKLIDMDESTKLFFVGHGLGGMIALELYNKFVNQFKVRPTKLVLSNFILNIDDPIFKLENKIRSFSYLLLSHSRLFSLYTPNELSFKKEAQLNYEEDPFIILKPTYKAIFEVFLKSKVIYQDSYFLDLPVMIAWSENNRYLNHLGMNYFIKGIKKELIHEKRYSLMKHDLYNEIDSENFFIDIKKWVEV